MEKAPSPTTRDALPNGVPDLMWEEAAPVDPGRIRPIAICVFRRGEDILVAEGYDRVKDEMYYRPPGGAIEFGEHSRDGVVREIREELSAEIHDPTYLGVIESVFTCDGKPGHEIVIIYGARFADERFYSPDAIPGREHDGTDFTAVWKPLAFFRRGEGRLVPEGLLELLDKHA